MRILVIRFSALGDVVLTSGVMSWLHKNLNTFYQGCEPSKAKSIFAGHPFAMGASSVVAPNVGMLSINASDELSASLAGASDKQNSNSQNSSGQDSAHPLASQPMKEQREEVHSKESGLGKFDLDTGIGAVKSVPDAELCTGVTIDVLTFGEYEEVWSGAPFVHRVFTVPRGIALADYMNILRGMPEYNYILDLHANTRSFIARKIFKGASYRYDKDSVARRLFVKFRVMKDRLQSHVVQKYAEAALPIMNNIAKLTEAPQVELPTLEEVRPTFGVDTGAPQEGTIVMHPFASKATKTWSGAADLAKELVNKGYKVKIVGEGEFPQINGVDRVNTPSIKELIACIAEAELFITTDSGPMHMAVALKRRVLAIFGSTTKELGFFPSFNNCYVMQREDVDCRPCDIHGLDSCPRKHFKCMDIKVDEVLERVASILPLQK